MKKAPQKLPAKKLLGAAAIAAIWTVAATIAAEIMVELVFLWILGKETYSQPIWSGIIALVSGILSIVLVIVVPMKFVKNHGITRESLGLKDLPTWTDIGLGMVGYIAAAILSSLLTMVFMNFSWFNATQFQQIGFDSFVGGFDRVIAFFTLAVLAPIIEEILFRGFLYGKLRDCTNSIMKPIWSVIISSLVTSLLFALVHPQWNVAVDVFALSIVLCGLREITGTIYAGMIVHMLKNGIAFYLRIVLGIH